MFLLYNFIQQQNFFLEYNLLIKKQNWSNIYKVVNIIFHNHSPIAAIKIKAINKYSDPDIIKLE